MNNLFRNVRPLKNSFVKEGKGKFYLGEEEPVKMAGVNVPGFKIFKEQIVESLIQNNKETVMKKAIEKMGTEAIEELLCLPPNKEPPQDVASIISDSFCDVFYEKTDVITSGLYEDENSVFLVVNDIKTGFPYLCDVDPDGHVHFNFDCSCMFDINSIQLDSLNMGTNENPKCISISHDLTPKEREKFERILTKRKVVFAWSYEDMSGLDRDIAEHHIPTYPEAKPVKQKLRRLRPEWTRKYKRGNS